MKGVLENEEPLDLCVVQDHILLLQNMIHGTARWEFFTGSKTSGEICVNGLRYATHLDEFGLPVISDLIEQALMRSI